MNKILIDLGAHKGESIEWFSKYYDLSGFQIIAFEPNTDLHFYLHQVTRKYRACRIVPYAAWISDESKSLKMGHDKWSASSTLIKKKKVRGKIVTNKEVECIDIAQYIRYHFLPTDYIILKMNIEGAEYQVIPHLFNTGVVDWVNKLYVAWHWNKMNMPKNRHMKIFNAVKHEIWDIEK